jgi:hypothetical protein
VNRFLRSRRRAACGGPRGSAEAKSCGCRPRAAERYTQNREQSRSRRTAADYSAAAGHVLRRAGTRSATLRPGRRNDHRGRHGRAYRGDEGIQ